ncbi:hypothetical protein NP233_g9777 [Leucocoprinus birnbaumii]|uniref:Uncharacterized protein n=1 Tax=Leucocoprinus birnbaumii TaxID=56174 RepID=A0AAD5YMV5_9AGAR|nr:hypothetical protein NP233_g9777 [Leucocoprinus birnbaumii]
MPSLARLLRCAAGISLLYRSVELIYHQESEALFYAYIAAVYVCGGQSAAQEWIQQLISHYETHCLQASLESLVHPPADSGDRLAKRFKSGEEARRSASASLAHRNAPLSHQVPQALQPVHFPFTGPHVSVNYLVQALNNAAASAPRFNASHYSPITSLSSAHQPQLPPFNFIHPQPRLTPFSTEPMAIPFTHPTPAIPATRPVLDPKSAQTLSQTLRNLSQSPSVCSALGQHADNELKNASCEMQKATHQPLGTQTSSSSILTLSSFNNAARRRKATITFSSASSGPDHAPKWTVECSG